MGCTSDESVNDFVGFYEKQHTRCCQVEGMGCYVLGRLARNCAMSVPALLTAHFGETGLEGGSQLVERSVEVVRQESVLSHCLEQFRRSSASRVFPLSLRTYCLS